jgi:hypothetical protein
MKRGMVAARGRRQARVSAGDSKGIKGEGEPGCGGWRSEDHAAHSGYLRASLKKTTREERTPSEKKRGSD